MNCYPKINRKKFTAWCEECNKVFDDPTIANEHEEKEKHRRIRKTEYLIMQDLYFY
jgi:hypothetical protein